MKDWLPYLWDRIRPRNHRQFRRGFLAGFNFAVGKAGLPPEVHDWPSALKELPGEETDFDHNCS